jgi:DNA-binding transcriptional ArsR family regulator
MTAIIPGNPNLRPIARIDRLIHEPARLMILSVLHVVESADFTFLLGQTGLSRGNLSSHLGKLEVDGYIAIQKEFVEKTPHTQLSLTTLGRQAYLAYRQNLAEVLALLGE